MPVNFSVNTNVGAMIALQQLNQSNKMLDKTQLNVTTGLKINGPKDDPSTFAIAQNMRGDVGGMMAVRTALADGESTVAVAVTGGKQIADLLIEMKAKVVQANQAGLDSASRTALQNDFDNLRNQIITIVATAQFNGKNLIQASSPTLSVLSTVQGSTINISAQTLDPTALGINAADLTSSANAATALTAINTAIQLSSEKLAALGSAAKRIELQSEFTVKLIDILKEGIGNLVDADLAEESAKLQALQIKQQLGVQALGIANQRPQQLLQLFQQ
jgi:flagellin